MPEETNPLTDTSKRTGVAPASQRASRKKPQEGASAPLQEKKLTAPSASPDKPGADSSETGHKLQAILAEYTALRAEIQFLSDFQNRLLQLHATALTLIIGAAFSLAAGPWIVFLIPIEASIFGLWFNDHAIVIEEIGHYIQSTIERGVADLLHEPLVMKWETSAGAELDAPDLRRFTFRRLLSITFSGPSLIALFISLVLIILSIPTVRNFLPDFLDTQLPMAYPGIRFVLACFMWICCVLLWLFYINYAQYRTGFSDWRKTKSKELAGEQLKS